MTKRPFPRAFRIALATALALLLQACAGSVPAPSRGSQPVATTPPPVRQPAIRTPRDAQIVMVPGLEGVLGATAGELTGQFGAARLDIWEGDARKLQFSGTACVLDIYLYPTARSREPLATHVDARRASDANAVDRASCVKALRGR